MLERLHWKRQQLLQMRRKQSGGKWLCFPSCQVKRVVKRKLVITRDQFCIQKLCLGGLLTSPGSLTDWTIKKRKTRQSVQSSRPFHKSLDQYQPVLSQLTSLPTTGALLLRIKKGEETLTIILTKLLITKIGLHGVMALRIYDDGTQVSNRSSFLSI